MHREVSSCQPRQILEGHHCQTWWLILQVLWNSKQWRMVRLIKIHHEAKTTIYMIPPWAIAQLSIVQCSYFVEWYMTWWIQLVCPTYCGGGYCEVWRRTRALYSTLFFSNSMNASDCAGLSGLGLVMSSCITTNTSSCQIFSKIRLLYWVSLHYSLFNLLNQIFKRCNSLNILNMVCVLTLSWTLRIYR